MKIINLFAAIFILVTAKAFASTSSNLACDDSKICQEEAIQAITKKLSVPRSQVTVLGATMVGDGSFASRIFMVSVLKEHDANPEGYVIRFNTDSADSCDVTPADAKIEMY